MARKSSRQDWMLPLTRPVKIKGLKATLHTIGDVRSAIFGLPKHFQDAHTQRHVAAKVMGDPPPGQSALERREAAEWAAA